MRFKSVFGSLFFIITASIIALSFLVQSERFGSLLTKVISDLSERKTKAKISIQNVEFSFFPPGIELNKVEIDKKISDKENFRSQFGKLGFYLNFIEIEERKITFGELKIADAVIDYSFPEKDEKLEEINRDLINQVFELPRKSPIRIDTLLLENVSVIANHELLEIRRLKLLRKPDSYVARFHIANLNPTPEGTYKIDEIWGDGEVTRENIDLHRLKILQDVNTLLVKGSVKEYYKLKKSTVILKGEAHVFLKSIEQFYKLPEGFEIAKGMASLSFNLTAEKGKISAKSDFKIEDFHTSYFKSDSIVTSVELENNLVSLKEFKLVYQDQSAILNQPTEVFDLTSKEVLTKPLSVTVENLSFDNVLSFLPSLDPLKGKLTGKALIEKKGNDFIFSLSDGFKINQLALVVGPKEKPFTILKIKTAKFKDAEVAIVNNEFQLTAFAELPNSLLEIDGFINKKEVKFFVADAKIDLEDFGNIANLDVKGAGRLSIDVSGPLKDVVINLKGKTNNFEILGYRLGETEKNLSIELGKSEVVIHRMESLAGKAHLSGVGSVNYENSDIALGINSPDATYSDLTNILHPILSKIEFLPEDLDLKAKVDVDIFGKTRMDQLKINANVDFTGLTAYGEHLSEGSFQVKLSNQILSFLNFQSDKGDGNILGNFSFDLKSKFLELAYQWENLDLLSFNHVRRLGLNLNGDISGRVKGSGPVENYLLKLENKIFNTKSQNHVFPDSDIKMDITPKHLVGKANLLGSMFIADLDVNLKDGKNNKVNLDSNVKNIKPFLVAVFGQHLDLEEIVGSFKFNLDAEFDSGFKNLNLVAHLPEMKFLHENFKLNYQSTKPEFVVKNSHIQAWDLNLKQPDIFLSTKGEGVFGGSVSLVHEVHVNSKIIEILLAPVLSSEGFLKTIVRIDGKGKDYDFTVSSRGSNLNISLDVIPIPINDLNYAFEFSGQRLLLQELSSTLDNGSISFKGDIFFDGNDPDINIKYQLDRAEFPILGKSVINLTGEGILLGNDMPYNLSGELVLNKAQIVNELDEFSSKSSMLPTSRFLPKNQTSPLGKLLNLNLIVKAENPIKITNSLMDVALRGEIHLSGNPSQPRGEGRLYSPLNQSRIFFKNNEYLITNADINFSSKKPIANPDFDIQALTYISTYKVYPKAYGDLERFNFDLASDPPLPRNSILSLIAFGYTDEIQSTLRPEDQQSLTQVGVGSFVFDRFKISDILNKQFGLQVNLGTVFEQSQTESLLSGRSQGNNSGSGPLGRTRSATKIELKKRLDEALTLSVSSTMGGSIGQRQSMNLNYGITKKVQLEGVYELRTNEEGEENIIDNSIGADLKFRWSFK